MLVYASKSISRQKYYVQDNETLPGEGEGSCGRLNDLRPRPFLMSSSKDSINDSHSDTGVLHTLPPINKLIHVNLDNIISSKKFP